MVIHGQTEIFFEYFVIFYDIWQLNDVIQVLHHILQQYKQQIQILRKKLA